MGNNENQGPSPIGPPGSQPLFGHQPFGGQQPSPTVSNSPLGSTSPLVSHDANTSPDRNGPVSTPPATTKTSNLTWRTLGLCALATVVGLGYFVWRSEQKPGPKPLSAADVSTSISKALEKAKADAAKEPAKGVEVYNRVAPSMVIVLTGQSYDEIVSRSNDSGNSADTGAIDIVANEEAEDPFGGIGAGVVINDKGAILTAHHVIADAPAIAVQFSDGTYSPVEVTSEEPEKDIAVLQPAVLPEVLVPAVLGGGVQVGDDTYALGHPLGLGGSFSAGVVSALNRTIPVEDDRTLTGLIQFDAAVNPGNSGGPLLNRDGQVVGIVTALVNPTKQNFFIGIGFAVPIATAVAGGAGGPPQ